VRSTTLAESDLAVFLTYVGFRFRVPDMPLGGGHNGGGVRTAALNRAGSQAS
jgi:hypothetical protein